MSFTSKTYKSKNNQIITIRHAVPDDAQELRELKLQYLKNTQTIPLFDFEYPNDTDQEREMIERYQSEKNSIILVASIENIMVGNIDLTGSWRKKMEHTAMIGMGVHTKWQNQGIGTLLLQNTLDWAKENPIVHIAWLEVYASNTSGIALYHKMGFQQVGRIPNFFLEKGRYIDKIIMNKDVSKNSTS
ncbi:GNAT family N-acetyltransferase [Aquimarina litoralis]|uniref:GNAT family N-acetyltransferase n=1 Tax=Aquimarina litoralis TaxID=584605 RepID=UPI001C56D2EF|nr:N-acetyltransferase [Aquimarina litoralis]MBW1293987.1 GNAT family N-acetyltransferase [Aquimarina litoralis]